MLRCVLFFLTLALNPPVAFVRINQIQKLGDLSCILELFPVETNGGRATGRHVYVVLSEGAG